MHKRFLYRFFLPLLLCPSFLWSQDGVTVTDTVIQTQTTIASDSTIFRPVVKNVNVAVRSVPQSRLDSFRSADDFWYANTAPERKKNEAQETPRRSRNLMDKAWFRNLMWIIVLSGFIAIVIWYLYSSKILLFRRSAKNLHDETEGTESTDIFALNYEKEIAKAIGAKDYRLALRLWYLRTLKDLSDKTLIDYQYGRTNSDYVQQLRNTAYYREFASLTRAFEYTWYGQFALPEEFFANMQTEFVKFKKALVG